MNEILIDLLSDVTIRVHFANGTTLRMSKASYLSGSWKNGTSRGLVRAVQG